MNKIKKFFLIIICLYFCSHKILYASALETEDSEIFFDKEADMHFVLIPTSDILQSSNGGGRLSESEKLTMYPQPSISDSTQESTIDRTKNGKNWLKTPKNLKDEIIFDVAELINLARNFQFEYSEIEKARFQELTRIVINLASGHKKLKTNAIFNWLHGSCESIEKINFHHPDPGSREYKSTAQCGLCYKPFTIKHTFQCDGYHCDHTYLQHRCLCSMVVLLINTALELHSRNEEYNKSKKNERRNTKEEQDVLELPEVKSTSTSITLEEKIKNQPLSELEPYFNSPPISPYTLLLRNLVDVVENYDMVQGEEEIFMKHLITSISELEAPSEWLHSNYLESHKINRIHHYYGTKNIQGMATCNNYRWGLLKCNNLVPYNFKASYESDIPCDLTYHQHNCLCSAVILLSKLLKDLQSQNKILEGLPSHVYYNDEISLRPTTSNYPERWLGQDIAQQNWKCTKIKDLGTVCATCQMCGKEMLRYVHHMEHESSSSMDVGLRCAGFMEGNIFAAELRHKKLKARAKRRNNWPNLRWERTKKGNVYIKTTKNPSEPATHTVAIRKQANKFLVCVDGTYLNSRYDTINQAKWAGFDYLWPATIEQ